jgi:hypothetical protein
MVTMVVEWQVEVDLHEFFVPEAFCSCILKKHTQSKLSQKSDYDS